MRTTADSMPHFVARRDRDRRGRRAVRRADRRRVRRRRHRDRRCSAAALPRPAGSPRGCGAAALRTPARAACCASGAGVLLARRLLGLSGFSCGHDCLLHAVASDAANHRA